MKMPCKLKAQWIAALRSGDYEQGKGFLQKNDKFCCLGVLQEISGVEKGLGLSLHGACTYDGCDTLLSPNTQIRFDCHDAGFTVPGGHRLSALNDSGVSFANIADLIEEHVEVSDEPNT